MSEDRYTEITEQSWFGRIGNAIKGILVGLILFVVAFPLLFWNEGRSVKTFKTLKEGGKAAVAISSDRVDQANTGKLVYLTGKAVTNATLNDSAFGITAEKALKLRRDVEMYQWKEYKSNGETRKKFGGGTETVTNYTYDKVWSGQRIDSSSFKKAAEHKNPATFSYESREWVASPIMIGAFQLSGSLAGQIENYTPLDIKPDAPIPPALQGKAKLANAGFYFGSDPSSPQIGDLRVTYKIANPTQVSIITRQINDTFEPWQAKAGGTIDMLQTGLHSVEEMIQSAQETNKIITWILRAVGFFLMWAGLNLVLSPLVVIADIIPFIGNIVGAGTGLITFLLAGVCWLLTVAIAWFVYRPLLGIVLIAAAVGLTTIILKKIRKKTVAVAPMEPSVK